MKDVFASGVLVVLVVLLVNPLGFWMPMPLHVMVLGAVVATLGAVAVFLLRERAADEREESHRALAGRIAFLAGSAALVAGIGMQSLRHDVDPWLIVALAVMVVAKIATRLYADRYL